MPQQMTPTDPDAERLYTGKSAESPIYLTSGPAVPWSHFDLIDAMGRQGRLLCCIGPRVARFFETVVNLPVTSYLRRSIGVESTTLVTGLP